MTETQEAPPANKTAEFVPAKPRGAAKTGFPTDGYWVIAGLPKGGKTSLATSIPGAYVLELEKGGADRLAGWIQDVPDMPTFKAAMKFAINDPSVKVIVVDTLDMVLRFIGQEVANKYGLESMSDKKEGVNGFAVWEELFSRVNAITERFKECGKLVLLLCHFKDPRLDNEGKLVITQSIDAPSSKISSHICSQADVIGVCAKKRIGDKSQYTIKFHGEGIVGAFGSRLPELEDKTVVLPRTKQWQAIVDLFNAPVEPTKKSEPVKAAAAKTNGKKS